MPMEGTASRPSFFPMCIMSERGFQWAALPRLLTFVAALGVLVSAPVITTGESEATRSNLAGMSGTYRLRVSFGPSCLLGSTPATVVVNLAESGVTEGLEVEGTTVKAADALESYLALLRRSARIHGAVGTTGPSLGVTTQEGRRVWMQIMLDGAVDASSSLPKAQGTAFGEIQMSAVGDETPDSLGSCSARDHTFSLEAL